MILTVTIWGDTNALNEKKLNSKDIKDMENNRTLHSSRQSLIQMKEK